MFIPKPNEGGDYAPAPAGTHIARCFRFVDLGTHASEYNGEKKIRREVLLSWELSDEFMDDGRPFTVNKRYTWSMHEKSTLRKHLESWRKKPFADSDFEGPTAFDTKNVVGKPCTITIVQTVKPDGKVGSKVEAVGPMIKGAEARDLVNAPAYLALTHDRWDGDAYAELGEYFKGLIAESPEYKELMQILKQPNDPPARGVLDDDIPF